MAFRVLQQYFTLDFSRRHQLVLFPANRPSQPLKDSASCRVLRSNPATCNVGVLRDFFQGNQTPR